MLRKILPAAVIGLLLLIPAVAISQEDNQEPVLDVDFDFTAAEGAVVAVGVLAGLTTAYLGYRKAKRDAPPDQPVMFDITKFMDRVIPAVIASVPLAIGSAVGVVTLNLFTIILIYLASLGSAELTLEIAGVRGSKKQ